MPPSRQTGCEQKTQKRERINKTAENQSAVLPKGKPERCRSRLGRGSSQECFLTGRAEPKRLESTASMMRNSAPDMAYFSVEIPGFKTRYFYLHQAGACHRLNALKT
jgi:hypothetical protein